MNLIRHLASSLGILIISCGVAHGYLLQNSFFDEDGIDWNDGVGWESFGPTNASAIGQHDWANGAPGALDETFGLIYGQEGDTNWGVAFQCWTATFGGFYQDVPVVPGNNYYFEIESHAGCNSPAGDLFPTTSVFMITFDWYDMDPDLGGTLVAGATNFIVPKDGGCDGSVLPGDYRFSDMWDQWAVTNTAPGGAAVLRLAVAWDAGGVLSSNGSEAVRWDNAFLTTDTLDPVNQSLDPTDDLFAMSFNAQSSLVYTLESSTDVDTWSPTVHPDIDGDDTEHTLYDMPGVPTTAWRVGGLQQGNSGAFLNLLSNGDFELPGTGATATDWIAWTWGGAWANTEQAGWGSGSWHLAAGHWGGGGGGFFQLVSATAGLEYTLSVSSGADTWFLPTGRMEMFFFDVTGTNVITNATDTTVDPVDYGTNNYDIAHPWSNYTISGIAPAGTTTVKVEFSCNENSTGNTNWIGATGSVGFDNAVLTDGVTINTNPPPAIIPYALDLWQTNSVLIAFDGQLGVHYQLQYSEDSGSTWFDTLHPIVAGDGTRQRVYDPEGPSGTRQYRMRPAPDARPPTPP